MKFKKPQIKILMEPSCVHRRSSRAISEKTIVLGVFIFLAFSAPGIKIQCVYLIKKTTDWLKPKIYKTSIFQPASKAEKKDTIKTEEAAISSATSSPAATIINERRTDCPLDKEDLGRNTWGFLHSMAAYFPETPTLKDQTDMKSFINIFAKFYPCEWCAYHLRERWMCTIFMAPSETSYRDPDVKFSSRLKKSSSKLTFLVEHICDCSKWV